MPAWKDHEGQDEGAGSTSSSKKSHNPLRPLTTDVITTDVISPRNILSSPLIP